MSTDELRHTFLLEDLFVPGAATLRFVDLDRVVLGGIVPTDGPIALTADPALAAAYFAERREIGILNIGGDGHIKADGVDFPMQRRDVLYVGRGTRDISFASDDDSAPARYYLVSYPAHATHPASRIARGDATMTELGSIEHANRRRLYKYIHPGGSQSAQLVMGVTELELGSVWNTMPAHTHVRRTEVYLYFDVPPDAAVMHFMGEPEATRNLVVRDSQVVLSPPWSIHSGCGTTNYTFCWAMGGENQDFADMQMVNMETLR